MIGLVSLTAGVLLGKPRRRISVVPFAVDGISAILVESMPDAIAAREGSLVAEPHLQGFGVRQADRASFTFCNTREEADLLTDVLVYIMPGARGCGTR